jgi:hypothetical protein
MKKLSLFVCLACLFAACTSQTLTRTPQISMGGATPGHAAEDKSSAQENRVFIYNASLQMVVNSPDSLNSRLFDIAKKYGGYAVHLGNRHSTIRVTAPNLSKALGELTAHGKIKNQTISGNDVTEAYRDYGIRLDNANKARQRYLDLLQKAENVEAALKVEKELERLNGEIENLKGKLERLKHLSDYSTIGVSMEEKQRMGILGYVFVGIYRGVKWLFVRD